MPPFLVVDAFTARPFAGNPAAVVFLEAARSDDWMQRVASEFNLSETAFVRPEGSGYSLRWFTPTTEVELCGHATLASAHALWDSGRLEGEAVFDTLSGELRCRRSDGGVAMDFPSNPPVAADPPPALLRGLGLERAIWVGRCSFDYLVELATESEVAALAPDFDLLRSLKARGVGVTAPSDSPDVDFVSRCFAPNAGVDEDPVTGSTHTMLGPHWAGKLNRDRVVGKQISRRSGLVDVTVDGERVTLRGNAVTIARGELLA
jgi:PhzF family phenazine biosynthesis protein